MYPPTFLSEAPQVGTKPAEVATLEVEFGDPDYSRSQSLGSARIFRLGG